jgi:hypothetical protein
MFGSKLKISTPTPFPLQAYISKHYVMSPINVWWFLCVSLGLRLKNSAFFLQSLFLFVLYGYMNKE